MNNGTRETVGRTIIDQLGGAGRLVAMTGAKDILLLEDGVCFKLPRGRYVEIVLASDDTYTVEFSRLVKYEKRGTKSFSMIYAENLKSLFESETGLYLSL